MWGGGQGLTSTAEGGRIGGAAGTEAHAARLLAERCCLELRCRTCPWRWHGPAKKCARMRHAQTLRPVPAARQRRIVFLGLLQRVCLHIDLAVRVGRVPDGSSGHSI